MTYVFFQSSLLLFRVLMTTLSDSVQWCGEEEMRLIGHALEVMGVLEDNGAEDAEGSSDDDFFTRFLVGEEDAAGAVVAEQSLCVVEDHHRLRDRHRLRQCLLQPHRPQYLFQYMCHSH